MSRGPGDMARYYAARASHYEKVYDYPERAGDIATLERHLRSRFAGHRVLEVACGTGFWTRRVAEAAAAIVATDAVPETIEVASVRSAADNVRYVVQDAYHLPDSLGTFDAALAGLWLSHVPVERRREFLQSLHVRLDPGAPVTLFDNNRAQLARFPIVHTDPAGNTYQDRTWEDGETYRVLKNFPTEDELRSMVSGYGTDVQHQDLENFWVLDYAVCPV